MLAVLGMSTVIGMAGNNIAKNILAMAVGLIFSCIGMSPQTGLARFTFGQVSLMDGISLIPMLIGLFGITCLLYTSFYWLLYSACSIAGPQCLERQQELDRKPNLYHVN